MRKCPRCGEDNPDVALPPPARKRKWLRWLLVVVVAVVVGGGLYVLYALLHLYEWAMTPMEMTEDGGRGIWEPMVPAMMLTDENCTVTRTFYNGWHKAEKDFFWSVECEDGRQVVLLVETKAGGQKTLDCSAAKALKVNCFEPIERRSVPR
jgi:hypothetical protein